MYSKFHSLINDFWLTPLLANESEKKRPTKTFLFSSPIGKQQTDKFKNDIVNRDDDHVDNIPIQRIKITPLKCPSPSAYSTVESLEPPPPSIQKIHSKKVHKYTLRYALDLEKKGPGHSIGQTIFGGATIALMMTIGQQFPPFFGQQRSRFVGVVGCRGHPPRPERATQLRRLLPLAHHPPDTSSPCPSQQKPQSGQREVTQ